MNITRHMHRAVCRFQTCFIQARVQFRPKLGRYILAPLFILAGLAPNTLSAYAPSPDLYIMMFRADWCAPCKIVEPNIAQALQSLNDPGIEYVTIDISNPSLSEISAHRAFDRNIVPQYNRWLGVTGFAAIIDADTKNTLGCVNLLYDAQSMATHIKNLKTFALANQPSLDVTCPEPNGHSG